jgi:sugar phosphate isomerase/epimerase
MTALALLERATQLGVSVVQIADRMPLHELAPADLAAIRTSAAERRLTLEIGTWGTRPEQLIRYVEIAAFLGAPLIRTVIETDPGQPSPSDVVRNLVALVPQLESRGVSVAIENHERVKARVLRQIVDDIGSKHIGVCLDTANSLGCSEGAEEVLTILGPRTICLHLKDYRARRLDHRFGFLIEGAPAGAGDLDIPHWLARLREFGCQANVILELWPPPESAGAEATISKEKQWAEQSVAYLRQFVAH